MKALLAGVLFLTVSSVSAEEALDQFVFQIDLRESIGNSPSQPISLAGALEEALAQNVDLALARADEQIARESRFTTDATLYPSLEVGFSGRRRNGR